LTLSSTKIHGPAPDLRHPRGIVDTSILIEPPPEAALPEEASVAAVTLAELAAGVHATGDPRERAVRQERLQRVEATLEAIPFDTAAARAYGRVFAAVAAGGRKARGKRALDLLIAATAAAAGLPLYTRNVDDFSGLEGVVEIVGIEG
jgi:predicted nucleic acid-binding protein